MGDHLTTSEKEAARRAAVKAMRRRLDERKPDQAHYIAGQGVAAQVVIATLTWAKAFVPVIALLAALASAVRTVQTASEIYRASGSSSVGVVIAALAFTVSVEGALFVLALAQESNPDEKGLGKVIGIAFTFAIASNAYLGLRPLLQEVGSTTLQGFVADLVSAPAQVQMTFLVDLVAVLFPPLMALKAGHLTAHFAAEIAAAQVQSQESYTVDLESWRYEYSDPLATEEGQALLAEYLADKSSRKSSKARPTMPPVMVTGNGHNGNGSAHN